MKDPTRETIKKSQDAYNYEIRTGLEIRCPLTSRPSSQNYEFFAINGGREEEMMMMILLNFLITRQVLRALFLSLSLPSSFFFLCLQGQYFFLALH